jgi:serine/threonine protein kinase
MPTPPPDFDNERTIPPDAPTAGFEGSLVPGEKWDGRVPYQLGRYRLDQKLGEGGMGAVYLALDGQLDRVVALKIPFLKDGVNDSLYPRFLREARAAAGLRHPNICPLFDIGEADGIPFLSMAFIQGEPLSRRVGKNRPMPIPEAVSICRKIALAMAEAHKQRIIHRDLKPVNVLMDETGEPIILDFGLARREDAVAALTVQGQVMGTPMYMPPEQLNGDVAKMGPGCDIYSLGVMLYELLTGRPPFEGDIISLASQVLCDPPPSLASRRPGIDPKLERIVMKALAKEPQDRWPTMTAFADALAEWSGSVPPAKTMTTTARFLTLRVEGTPHAYRAAPNQQSISVGRQRRKPGEPDDQGNDFVVRVAGNDTLSARISRRHLEIHRAADGFTVVDRSKAGTSHNGQPLTPGMMTRLTHGDRLVIAGVVTLVVELDDNPRLVPVSGEVAVPAAGSGGGKVMLEASIGDMMTIG